MMLITYSEPFARSMVNPAVDSHVQKDDAAAAVEYFNKIGDLKILYLNPYYLNPSGRHHLNAVFPEDVEVLPHAGCAGWEIMAEVETKKDKIIVGTKIPKENTADNFSNPAEKPQDGKDVSPAPLASPDRQTVGKRRAVAHPVKPSVVKAPKMRIMKQENTRIMKQTGHRGRPIDPTAASRSTLWRRARAFPKMQGKVLI